MSVQRIEAGMDSIKTSFARLITSDSVVDLLVEVCCVVDQVNGKYVLGPVRPRKLPEGDLASSLSPAKCALAYRDSSRSPAGSPVFPFNP